MRYECLTKPRKKAPTESENELIRRLNVAQSNGDFNAHPCDIGDLQTVKILESRKRLGKGELSSIAFAMKIRQAFITDDKKARKLAEDSGHTLTQTTPHLFSWLIFKQYLCDSDKTTVTNQHESMGRPLTPHLNDAYDMALQCRLNSVHQ